MKVSTASKNEAKLLLSHILKVKYVEGDKMWETFKDTEMKVTGGNN